MLPRLVLLVSASLFASGCKAGVFLTPAIEAPALRRAGQVTLGGNIRPSSPAQGTYMHAAVAVTDRIRVAGSGAVAYDGNRRRGGYGELLAGSEHALSKYFEVGVLGGVGYGDVQASTRPAPTTRIASVRCRVATWIRPLRSSCATRCRATSWAARRGSYTTVRA